MFIQISPACISLPDRALPCIFDLEQKEIHKHYMFVCFAAYSLATFKVCSYTEKHTSWYVFLEFGDFCIVFHYCLVLPGTPALFGPSENAAALYPAANTRFTKTPIRLLPPPHIMLIQKAQEF